MDSFNYMVTIVLMMLAMQFGEGWMSFAILFISIISTKDLQSIILLIISGVVLYLSKSMGLFDYWPIILVGLIGLSFVLGTGKSGGQPEYYNPDPFGGLMGGGV